MNKNSIYVGENGLKSIKNIFVQFSPVPDLSGIIIDDNIASKPSACNVMIVGDKNEKLYNCAVSYDNGKTFTGRRLDLLGDLYAVTYTGNYWIVGGERVDGYNLAISNDSVTWELKSVNLSTVTSVAYNNGFLVVGGYPLEQDDSTFYLSSDNGNTWFFEIQLGNYVNNILYTNLCIIVSCDDTIYNIPLNGNILSGGGTTDDVKSLSWLDNYLIMSGFGNSVRINKTSDNLSPNLASTEVNFAATCSCSNNFKILIGTSKGDVKVTTNGVDFETYATGLQNVSSIAYTNDYKWIACGDKVSLSYDNVNWTVIDINLLGSIRNVCTNRISSSGTIFKYTDPTIKSVQVTEGEKILSSLDDIIFIDENITITFPDPKTVFNKTYTIINRSNGSVNFEGDVKTLPDLVPVTSLNDKNMITVSSNLGTYWLVTDTYAG